MIVFLAHTPDMLANYYGARAVAQLRELAELRLNETGRVLDDPAALAAACAGADIVIADRQTPAPAAFFDAAPDLLAICRVAVDIRNIDVEAASRNGILVTRATPGFAASVSELGIGFMVDLARGMTQSAASYRAGAPPAVRMGRQLAGAVLGIIGYGVIGRRLAAAARPLGMKVLVNDPFQHVAEADLHARDFAALLAEADFVVCLAPATESTENLMNAAAFAHMRRDAYFINLSRGNLVDEAALEQALDAGAIAGAAMDVGRDTDQKPSPRLAARPDVLATPHIGGLTPEAAEHQAFDTVRQVADLVQHRIPDNAVNADQAYRLNGWGT